MRRLNDDDGNVVIIVALLVTTLFGFLALTVDAGAMLVRRSSLQTGADAAALAIAKRCADAAVTGSATCTTSIAQSYFDDNSLTGAVAVPTPVLTTAYSGKAGRVTVTGSTSEQPFFAGVLGFTGAQTVTATATARWGPLTAEDEVFPIAVCKGAVPPGAPVGPSVTLEFDPAATGDPGLCDGAEGAQPFGWLTPDDPVACTTLVTQLPTTWLSVAPPDAVPASGGCNDAARDLLAAIHGTFQDGVWVHSGSLDDRTRVLAVYDAAIGPSGTHPSYALIAFEFTGLRVGSGNNDEADGNPTTVVCDASKICMRGRMRTWNPPTDGPIYDPTLAAALPNIEDTTVLDVRLVD